MEVFEIDGAKNTFVLLSFKTEKELFEKNQALILSAKFIQNLSARALGHPVDGVILLLPEEAHVGSSLPGQNAISNESTPDMDLMNRATAKNDGAHSYDFTWKFFNSDGSPAEMCGNAARAVSWWFYNHIESKPQIAFLASEIPIKAHILSEEQVSVSLRRVESLGKTSTGHYLYNSGVPHLVVFIPDNPEIYSEDEIHFEDSQSWKDLAKNLRFPKEWNEKGANVTLVWPTPNVQKVGAVTFERGVENWTMACGTGAMAAAYYAHEQMGFAFPIEVRMPGGILNVNDMTESTILSGPARIIQKKQIDLAEFW